MSQVETRIDEVLRAEEAAEDEGFDEDEDVEPEDPELEASADPDVGHADDDPHGVEPEAEIDEDRRDSLDLVEVGDILGVRLMYERVAIPRRARFRVARSFVPVIEAIVRQVQERVPNSYGELQRISSAGMYVDKPGRHGEGRACDWDRLVFENVEIAPIARDHRSPSRATRRRYWAFAAICRSNCCFLLHGEYDAAHADHCHADNSTGVGFNRSQSTVKLLQAVLNEIHGTSPRLQVDGDFGPRTSAAFDVALDRLGLSGDIGELDVWRRFLRRSARVGFTLPA